MQNIKSFQYKFHSIQSYGSSAFSKVKVLLGTRWKKENYGLKYHFGFAIRETCFQYLQVQLAKYLPISCYWFLSIPPENIRFSDVCRGYRKRPVARNGISYMYFPVFHICISSLNPLYANPTKWSNILKQFVGRGQRIV